VRRGLFGAFVIEPRGSAADTLDLAVIAHTFDGIPTLASRGENAFRLIVPNDTAGRQNVRAGTPVRLRLINSDSAEQRFTLAGAPFRVVAIDGADLNGPTPLDDATLAIGAGGRMDVAFTMPAGPVRLSLVGTTAAIGFSPYRAPPRGPEPPGPAFDPLTYGTPAPTRFGESSSFDRRFELTISRKPGFFNGDPGLQWAINGGIYPEVPMFVVEEGDLVEFTITNDTKAVHPMHLHGHHALVLSRDGVPSSGSPWWVDTLDLQPGERYVVALRADNPGVWMDHCHNLRHAADGLTMHVAYAGVTTPFRVGDASDNDPE
jgi:FtsP/CotA-like multicopper oxidase with cupredoxin domain